MLFVIASVFLTATVHGSPAAEEPTIVECFVVVGDAGKGSLGQEKVSAAIRVACEEGGGCDFRILNGDNNYPAGVMSEDDAPKMFAYARMQSVAQRKDATARRGQSTKPWRIVFGHHPYFSNGVHGNAGDYNRTGGLEGDGLPLGVQLKRFVDEVVIAQGYHAHLCGHDHNLQDLGEYTHDGDTRGTQMILSGAGSKLTDLRAGEIDLGDGDAPHNTALYQSKCYGFVMIEASAAALALLHITAPSGTESDCAAQSAPWAIGWEPLVDHYEPG